MVDRKQGAGLSSGSSAAGHKAHYSFIHIHILNQFLFLNKVLAIY